MSAWLEVKAYAKVNLALLVGARRSDGYHPLCSLMEKINLCDTVRTRRSAAGSGISVSGMDIPQEENIVYGAALAFCDEAGIAPDVEIGIDKCIPAAAGLGGGSSDAAAVMLLLAELFDIQMDSDTMVRLAAALGADVPFFLAEGPQLAAGIGELLEPVSLPRHALVVAVPTGRLSTAHVYRQFDRMEETGRQLDARCESLRRSVADLGHRHTGAGSGSSHDSGACQVAPLLQNDLEAAAFALDPAVAQLKSGLAETDGCRGALMTGSGSAVFGLFDNIEEARSGAALSGPPAARSFAVSPLL